MLVVSGTNAQGNQQLRDSLKAAADRLAYHPDSIDLRLQKASWNMQLEQWQYAQEEYDYVLERQPYNPAALYYRAYTNEKLHRYNFARLDYENLLTIVPSNFEARLGLALLNQKDKHYTEAMDQINLLVQQHPDSALAFAARANIEVERQMYSLAEYDFTEAILRDPENQDYLIGRVDVMLREEKYVEARKELDRLVSRGIPRASLDALYKRAKKKK